VTLILFDIDATLLLTRRAGVDAILNVGRDLYGDHFSIEGVSFAGSLDPVILDDLITRHGGDPTPDAITEYRTRYARELETQIAHDPSRVHALPGVHDVLRELEALTKRDDITLGLLTGNFPETGAMKVAAAGIDPSIFEVCVWGDDSPHHPPLREHLPPVAFDRYRSIRSVALSPERVTIIGDTPHDVRCALVNGCRALGVGTGHFTPEDLRSHGAHHAVDDLSDSGAIVKWLLNGALSR
jgi:phosphoglycolate phosphatase-like HAD superfamily hydrolase